MVRNKLYIILTVLLVTSLFQTVYAQKTTSDPNAAAPAEEKPASETVDKRLSEKVSYYKANVRLHEVCSELSEKTGVVIRAGRSNSDWQKRDLPLAVYATDIELGKLLRGIADCLHLDFTSYDYNGEKCYRIWRTDPYESEIANHYEAWAKRNHLNNRAWVRANEHYATQSVDAIKSVLPDTLKKMAGVKKELAELVADLDYEDKSAIISGEPLAIYKTYKDGKYASRITELEEANYLHTLATSKYEGVLNRSDLSRVSVFFETRHIHPHGSHVVARLTTPYASAEIGFSPYSELKDFLEPTPDIPYEPPTRMREILVMAVGTPLYTVPENWLKKGLPIFQEELELPMKLGKYESAHDILLDLSKATKTTLVFEDYYGHLPIRQTWGSPGYGGVEVYDPSVYEESEKLPFGVIFQHAFDKLQNPHSTRIFASELRFPILRWYVDKDTRLFVGISDKWYRNQKSLMPSKLLSELHNKACNKGIGREDAASLLVSYNDDQLMAWFLPAYDFYWAIYLDYDCGSNNVKEYGFASYVWRAFCALPQSFRDKAYQRGGLPVTEFNAKRFLNRLVIDQSQYSLNISPWTSSSYSQLNAETDSYRKQVGRFGMIDFNVLSEPNDLFIRVEDHQCLSLVKGEVDIVNTKMAFYSGYGFSPFKPSQLQPLTWPMLVLYGPQEEDGLQVAEAGTRAVADGPRALLQIPHPLGPFPVYTLEGSRRLAEGK